jgi:hypothetical protein
LSFRWLDAVANPRAAAAGRLTLKPQNTCFRWLVMQGRQAFLDLKCTACHAVPSERDFPAPVSANPGPPITPRVGSRDVSYLVTAIVAPSHTISPDSSDAVVRAAFQGRLLPMGDFSRVMTVRQLVDLEAYLRSIK